MRALLFLLLASCTHDLTSVDRIEDVKTGRDLDILYVLDTAPDHASYDTMASQLDVLQAQLQSVDGQLPNLHVGVVAADLGIRGTQDASPGAPLGNCVGDGLDGKLVTFNAAIDDRFLVDLRGSDGTRRRNFDSNDLIGELRQLTSPATADFGCEIPQPLEAMRRALDPARNPGFIRPGAQLMIVFLTNKDDCSLQKAAMLDPSNTALGPVSFRCTSQGVICDDDVAGTGTHKNCRPRDSEFMTNVDEYRTFLEQYKPDPRDVIVSAVAGARTPFRVDNFGVPVLAPSCQGATGTAKPAVRIGALVDAFGGVIVDSCTQDAAYQQLASRVVTRQRSCFPNLRRDDGADCRVTELAGEQETELAQCAPGSAGPCWTIDADVAACPGGDNLAIAINRGQTTIPTASRIEATCFLK